MLVVQTWKKGPKSLADYVENLQARGYYSFRRADARKALSVTDVAFKFAAIRLQKKGRLVSPRRGFFVIVPTEYRIAGAPPASWFIDDLMKFQEMPYYVGLLSAAALHGAAHQQPQEFQVITSAPLRPVRIGREKIKFFTKKDIAHSMTEKIKGATGYFLVSTPEATAFDLIRYYAAAGYLDNIATVLNELKEKLSPPKLVEVAKQEGSLADAQRLGYLLDYVKGQDLTQDLHKWLKKQSPLPTPLIPARKLVGKPRGDSKWLVVINEKIEVDK
jgi:predicted transcriptional regulator of viral defense system